MGSNPTGPSFYILVIFYVYLGAKILIFDRWFRPENEAEQGEQKRQYGKQKRPNRESRRDSTGSRRDRTGKAEEKVQEAEETEKGK
jgi:hypothetical protein